jgi:23S rRNA (cytidine1920-2'-O)/16S rRNA (cytidine1409-2'-O)-methyltransferase
MRTRLDLALVERGLIASRSRAQDLIKGGKVLVDGQIVTRASSEIGAGQTLSLVPDAPKYVSRGALKLAAALRQFEFDANDRVALDVGASTGGFTEVLLESGARKVYAIDVGRNQLHERLRSDPRVVSLESCDARNLTRELVPDEIDAIVADVSFISLSKAVGPALTLAANGAWLVALIKPQFEVGRANIGKGGIVRDAEARAAAVDAISQWFSTQHLWRLVGAMPSPIKGGSGNEEFLLGAVKDG